MPLADYDETPVPDDIPGKNVIAKPEFQGIISDNVYEPRQTLLTAIEGSPWTVDYYRQVLGKDNSLDGQKLGTTGTSQQYTLIRQFELKVTSALSASQDIDKKTMASTGNANVYAGTFPPNEGDMFVASIGDGYKAVFRITNSERKSIFKDAAYTIEYMLVDYASEERMQDLANKTINTLVFNLDFIQHGQNPLMETSAVELVTSLKRDYYAIVENFLQYFYSDEFATLIVPEQLNTTYDYYMAKLVTKIFSYRDFPIVPKIRVMNCDGKPVMNSRTLLDALFTRDARVMSVISQRSRLGYVNAFDKNPMLEGIRFSGIQLVVYPVDSEYNVTLDPSNDQQILTGENLYNPSNPRPHLPGEPPLICLVATDDYYIFSEHFYKRTPGKLSMLEVLVWDYLEHKALDNSKLKLLVEDSYSWDRLEQFYYLPILAILIKASIRSV